MTIRSLCTYSPLGLTRLEHRLIFSSSASPSKAKTEKSWSLLIRPHKAHLNGYARIRRMPANRPVQASGAMSGAAPELRVGAEWVRMWQYAHAWRCWSAHWADARWRQLVTRASERARLLSALRRWDEVRRRGRRLGGDLEAAIEHRLHRHRFLAITRWRAATGRRIARSAIWRTLALRASPRLHAASGRRARQELSHAMDRWSYLLGRPELARAHAHCERRRLLCAFQRLAARRRLFPRGTDGGAAAVRLGAVYAWARALRGGFRLLHSHSRSCALKLHLCARADAHSDAERLRRGLNRWRSHLSHAAAVACEAVSRAEMGSASHFCLVTGRALANWQRRAPQMARDEHLRVARLNLSLRRFFATAAAAAVRRLEEHARRRRRLALARAAFRATLDRRSLKLACRCLHRGGRFLLFVGRLVRVRLRRALIELRSAVGVALEGRERMALTALAATRRLRTRRGVRALGAPLRARAPPRTDTVASGGGREGMRALGWRERQLLSTRELLALRNGVALQRALRRWVQRLAETLCIALDVHEATRASSARARRGALRRWRRAARRGARSPTRPSSSPTTARCSWRGTCAPTSSATWARTRARACVPACTRM